MAVIYEIKERRVVPNWRDFKRTLQLGELYSSNQSQFPIKLNIDNSIEDWKQQKNIGTAAELVNAAFVSANHSSLEVDEAIKFLLSEESKTSRILIEIINEIKVKEEIAKQGNSILERDFETIQEFQTLINNQLFHKVISITKNKSKKELRNPIIWIELARLYSMKGQEYKAETAIKTALQLAPENRFVLRSATRFFLHTNQFEKALYFLRKSSSTKHDPWLISAHIATSSIMNRFSPLIKEGKILINSGNFSDFDLTELNSSIGTLELKDGSFKNAKKFFEHSMKCPNDNSLAQIEWISKNDKRFEINPFYYSMVKNPFEAFALEHFERGNWKEAFYNSIKWLLDMPFSKRPVLLGSYIASTLLNDKNAAIILCEVGLQANPNDPTILNNLLYSAASSDNVDMLNKYSHKLKELININSLSNENKITIQATLGLISIRKKDFVVGIKMYEQAIMNASIIKNDYLKNIAIVNLTRELIKADLFEKEKYVELLKNMKLGDNQKDLKLIRDEVIELYVSLNISK